MEKKSLIVIVMKKLLLICLMGLSAASFVIAEETELQESKKPSWIERLFGLDEVEEAKETTEEEVKEKKEDKAAKKVKQFTEEEREILGSWQKGNASWKKSKKPLPPGLQKKLARGGELPPGWKKKLGVGEVLEPEIYEASESLPEEILKQIEETETGAEVVRIGSQIIKVIKGSREIIDIIDGDAEEVASEDD